MEFEQRVVIHSGVLSLPMDEGAGAIAYDKSGEDNDGTFYGAKNGTITGADYVVGKYGYGLDFTPNDKVDLGTFACPEHITLAAWIKFETPVGEYDNDSIICKMSGVPPYLCFKFGPETTHNHLRFDLRINGTSYSFTDTTDLVAGTYYFIVATFDGTWMKIYLNGILCGSGLNTGESHAIDDLAGQHTYIGYEEANGRYFQGIIDEVRIYNRALTQAEVTALYANTGYPRDGTMVGEWLFEEGTGTTAYDTSMWTTGKYGTALGFDGVDDVVTIDKTLGEIGISDEYTVAAWVKYTVTPTDWMGICGDWGGSCRHLHFGVHSSIKFSNHIQDEEGQKDVIGTTTVTSGVWYFVVTTVKKDDFLRLFVNGVQEGGSIALVGDFQDYLNDLVIGRPYPAATTFTMNGIIDEVHIYDRVLTEEEIKNLYDYGSLVGKDCLSTLVTSRENAVADALIIANDLEGEVFLNKVDSGSQVEIYQRLIGASDWTLVFDGSVNTLDPELNISLAGEVCAIECYGAGIPLSRMRVKGEYGTESPYPTYKTIRSILATLDSKGVLYGYVNRVMGSAVMSGYNIGYDYIDDNPIEFKYLLWKGAPIDFALKDMCDLITAQAPTAGVHWQVLRKNGRQYLCLGKIGKHEECSPNPFDDIWPNAYAGGTLTVGSNILNSHFTKLPPEANYILAYGKFEYPINDKFTELDAANWTLVSGMSSVTDDADAKVGTHSIKGIATAHAIGTFRRSFASLDIYNISSMENPPTISFYVKVIGGETTMPDAANNRTIYVYVGGQYRDLTGVLLEDNKWYYIELPIGPWLDQNEGWVGVETNWHTITSVGFQIYDGGLLAPPIQLFVDGLSIDGTIGRAAYNSDSIAADGCKIKLVTDSLAKSDSLVAADDSGTLAQLVKAELLKCMETPTVGEIEIELDPDAMAGQLVTVANPRNTAFGTKSMRITEVKGSFRGSVEEKTYLLVTDDVLNSYPIRPLDAYNATIKASNPDHQTKNFADLTSRDIDINVVILAKDYA